MLTRIKNYSVLTAGDEVVCGCAQREVCHFISNWVGECPSVGQRVENKKRTSEIKKEERNHSQSTIHPSHTVMNI
jgi:hypothetical protein